jgi:nucleoside-diphosphate-sugar epimerase
VSRYVFVSSGVVHRDLHGRPAREEDVVLPEGDPPETELDYTSGKRWCERVLTDARELGFRGVAVRPPAVLGAADRTSRIAGYFARIEDGRPLLAPAGLLDRPLGIVWNRDIGVACALLAEGAGASSAYNVAVPDVPLRRLVGDAADVLGVARPELVEVDEQTLAAAGFDVYDVSPYGPAHKRPGGYDLTRVRTELGFEPSPLGAALVECAAWYRSVRPTGSGYARREEELALVTK